MRNRRGDLRDYRANPSLQDRYEHFFGGESLAWADQARALIRGSRNVEELRAVVTLASHLKAEAESAILDYAISRLEARRPETPSMQQAITFAQLAAETGYKEWKLREAGRLGIENGGLRTLRNGSRGVLVERGEGWRWVKAQRR